MAVTAFISLLSGAYFVGLYLGIAMVILLVLATRKSGTIGILVTPDSEGEIGGIEVRHGGILIAQIRRSDRTVWTIESTGDRDKVVLSLVSQNEIRARIDHPKPSGGEGKPIP